MNAAAEQEATRSVAIQAWRVTTWIAIAFLVVVAVGMILAHVQHKSSDPWRSSSLLELKAELQSSPRNENVKEQIRAADLHLREQYFRLLSLKKTGVHLMLGGAAVLVYAFSRYRRLERKLPMPAPQSDVSARLARQARLARNTVAATGLVGLVFLFSIAFRAPSSPLADPQRIAGLLTDDAPAVDPVVSPPPELFKANWHRFRGLHGAGIVPSDVPLDMMPEILWRVPSVVVGYNSPILWEDRLFMTGANPEVREVVAYSVLDGQLLWRQVVPTPNGVEIPVVSDMTGYAAPTAVTDGSRVYAMFASGELAAFTLDGMLVWSKYLRLKDNPYGHAASLAAWGDSIFVQLDQGYEDSRISRLIAFEGETGDVRWQTGRPVGASWATPIVVEEGGEARVIALGMPWVISYSAADGSERWRANALEGEVTSSPVVANELLFMVDPGRYQLVAYQLAGEGDVTETHEAWRAEGSMPDVTSPVTDGERVYTISSSGKLSCFNARSGDAIWETRLSFEGPIQASPSLSGQVLLVVSVEGEVVAMDVADEPEELWRAQYEDEFYASPAFAGGRLYLRGEENVWCLRPSSARTEAEGNQ